MIRFFLRMVFRRGGVMTRRIIVNLGAYDSGKRDGDTGFAC